MTFLKNKTKQKNPQTKIIPKPTTLGILRAKKAWNASKRPLLHSLTPSLRGCLSPISLSGGSAVPLWRCAECGLRAQFHRQRLRRWHPKGSLQQDSPPSCCQNCPLLGSTVPKRSCKACLYMWTQQWTKGFPKVLINSIQTGLRYTVMCLPAHTCFWGLFKLWTKKRKITVIHNYH